MKITHVISDSGIGGAGILLSCITSGLKDVFETEVIIPSGSKLKERLPAHGVKVTELNFKSDESFCPSDLYTFYRYFKNYPTDIIHTHAALSARLAGKLAGIAPCISTRHCSTPLASCKRKSPAARKIYSYCTDLTVSTADFATGNLIKEGIPRERIVTIKNGVDPRRNSSPEEKRSLLTELGIPEGSIILGCCGRLEKVKGQDLLILAAARLIRRGDDIYLLLVGDGSAKEEYKTLSARLGILSRVKFCGYVSDPEKYQSLFSINVNPSRGTETSCLASSECMSLGIPTVASDFGGNPEMIIPYINGLLFRSDDSYSLSEKLSSLLENPALCKRLSIGALKVYKERFSAERMLRDYENMYLSFSKT